MIGLFRGAISESGSALCPWSYQRHHKEIAYKLASSIDKNFSPNATSEQLLELLQGVTPDQINRVAGGVGQVSILYLT
ncbi:hypothetical protein NQ314_011714 [Rhamnusium bicolor]|uniref:Carboxylesterase type B domain-containing protein n=1 Tax=Rhamnusium bicolor TaxID=1586634 RepID=A0AAV8XH11_9CUCU|nr:hypothetical protein NQ314_011714 [Rhamnusium bicolor]